ncbi:MAG TPA: putative RNA uridine N3 methyltransferase [Nitrososphaeraceae archaeon]|nr:putative RNA uridine N3 methyltransferase [Nitrososphaeraceae archaeon]
MNKKLQLFVAIPDSSLSDEKNLREKTIKIGRFARSFSIFGINKIILYKDRTFTKNTKSDQKLMKLILDFLNTPQYLRKLIFPINPALTNIGLLPPIRAPQHKKKINLKDVKPGDLRIGYLYQRDYLNNLKFDNNINTKRKFHFDIANDKYKFYVDVGLDLPIPFLGKGIEGQKLVIKFIDHYPNLKAVRATECDMEREYLGYDIWDVDSLEMYLKSLEPKAFVVFTSRKGRPFNNMDSQFKDLIKKFNILLIVFGSPSKGIDKIYPNYHTQRNSLYLNLFPNQKTETIRLEEAILGTLAIFNHIMQK